MADGELQQQVIQLQNELSNVRKENQRLSLENVTLDAIGDGILVIGRDGDIIRINQNFLKMWQITPEEWANCQTYQEVKTLMMDRLHPNKNGTKIEDILRPTIDRLGLNDITLKNDTVFERYAGIRRTDDAIIGYVWSFRDVTDRRNAEKERNRSQAFLNQVIRNLPVILFAFNLDGNITFARGAALSALGLSQSEMEGLNILEEYRGTAFGNNIRRALQGYVTFGTHDFDGVFHEVYMGPMRENGEIIGVIGITLDVTDQKRAQNIIQIGKQLQKAKLDAEVARRRAEEANLAKSTFIANMSHELRTPLNSIIGFSQFLVRDQSLNHDQQEYASLIMRSSDHLLTLINEILDMAKIESGNIQLNNVDFDLSEILNSLDSIYHAKIANKDIRLELDIADDMPRYLWGDGTKLRQMLTNLLSNAVKFTETGGIMLLAWADENNPYHLYFQVKDTGIGIKESELPTLFEPFSQANSGRNSSSGTGLGLAITREFARLMGGHITVESTVDVGTAFTFMVRLKPAKNKVTATSTQPVHVIGVKNPEKQHKILIVDDRWENRMMLSRMLTELGFDIQEASDGQEAIQAWKTWQPDLVWMDMRMPGIDGYEATRRIRQSDGGGNVVIIALTASALDQDRERVMLAGCDDFLAKPFREASMYDMLTRHLGIEFVYETKPAKTNQTMKTVNDEIQELPEAIRIQLKQAIIELNLIKVRRIVGTFASDNPSLAKQILKKANDFDFDALAKWIP